jgi:hypothetical protein
MSEHNTNQKAVTFARKNKKQIAKDLIQSYIPSNPALSNYDIAYKNIRRSLDKDRR